MFEDKTDKELYQSLIAEIAKATAELKSAQSDLDKANSRQRFSLMLLNKLIERNED